MSIIFLNLNILKIIKNYIYISLFYKNIFIDLYKFEYFLPSFQGHFQLVV